MKKRLPKLKTDTEAEAFIEKDLSDYIHSDNFAPASFEYAPKGKTVSLRLSDVLLDAIKKASKSKGIPYQRFMRQILEQSVRKQS